MVTGVETRERALVPAGQRGATYSVRRVASSDAEEQAESLRAWNQIYEQLSPGPFAGSLEEYCFRGIQVFREITGQSVHEAGGAWPGSRTFGVPVRLEGTAVYRGVPFDADSLLTFGDGEELDLYTPRTLDILGVTVEERTLRAYAEAIEHRDVDAMLGGAHVIKPAVSRLAELRRFLQSVLASLAANPAALHFDETQRLLEQSIFGAILAVFGDADEVSAARPLCPSRNQLVERARAYMRSHIDAPITVADLCAHLGVSRRTLQYSFNEVLGQNPVRFLRALRLNGVRRDLKAARRQGASIQDVAARWGFWHLGHFVTDYKRMFGELPSDTLRSRGRRVHVS
jgi:AraC family ethanolamine operon transcriptional activator